MNLNNNGNTIYNFFKNTEIKKINKDLDFIDTYVLLTKYMQDALNIDKPFVVIEGISTDAFEKIDDFVFDEKLKTIFYSGGLVKKYGILDLVDAFSRIPNENYRLIICGSGEAEGEIIEASKKDSRIIFKGLIPREDVLKYQKAATVLINPRPNNEEYTKYSFPSKVMEYMSSGTPMVAYSLDGMPDEYDKYFFPIKDSKDGMVETLKLVLSLPDKCLIEKGIRAREFVLNSKNGKEQSSKIIQLIKEVKI
jgi:glycosyltransferase involved in cell wall biosynthesis